MNSALATLLGALVGASAGIVGAWLTGRRTAVLEREKWLRMVSDAFANDLRTTVKQLTTELARAAHSMCWLCWLAKFGASRLTLERVAQYDEEMHKLLPQISGLHAVVAGMDTSVYSELAPLVERTMQLDAAIGNAALGFEPGEPDTARALAVQHDPAVGLERDLHVVVARAIKGYASSERGRVQFSSSPDER